MVCFICTSSKESQKDAATYKVRPSYGSCEEHPIYLSETGEWGIVCPVDDRVENLLEKTRIEAEYKTALAAWNTAVCGEDNALKVLINYILYTNQDLYQDTVTECKPKRTALENAGLSMFYLLSRLLDPVTNHA